MLIKNNKNLTLHHYDPKDRIKWEIMREDLQAMKTLSKDVKLGGSDIGIILGLSDFKARGALYYEMIGMKPIIREENAHIYRGHAQEVMINDWYWQYFDTETGDMKDLMAASRTMKPLRESMELHAMVENKALPGMFANVDRLIKPSENVLEFKSMYRTALDKWEAGIPPYQIGQINSYMMVLEKDEAEIFILVDSTFPVMFQFKSDSRAYKVIKAGVDDFTLRVNSARKEMAKITDPDDAWSIAYEFEPEPENTPAYIAFLKEQHQPDNLEEPIEGDGKLLNHVQEYSKIHMNVLELKKTMVPHEVYIRKEFVDNGTKEICFPGTGYPNIKWDKKFSILHKEFIK